MESNDIKINIGYRSFFGTFMPSKMDVMTNIDAKKRREKNTDVVPYFTLCTSYYNIKKVYFFGIKIFVVKLLLIT